MATAAILTGIGVAKSIGLFDWLFNWVESRLNIPGAKTGAVKMGAVQAVVDNELQRMSKAGVVNYIKPDALGAYLEQRLKELKESGGLGSDAAQALTAALGDMAGAGTITSALQQPAGFTPLQLYVGPR